jgi:RNA polymerase sigma factor (sigma-70 family)
MVAAFVSSKSSNLVMAEGAFCNGFAYVIVGGRFAATGFGSSINGCEMTRSNPPTDLEAQLREGDDAVLEAILKAHGPPILALLKQRFTSRLTATDFEDVLAAALFRIWQNRFRFDPTLASLRVWFFRIAENTARDVLKHGWHKARQLEQSVDPALLAAVIDHRTEQDSANSHSDMGTSLTLRIPPDELQELLAMLPVNQRRIILADANSPEGLVASRDLANELGIPQATVRAYRRRGLERLRREIERRELAGVAKEMP